MSDQEHTQRTVLLAGGGTAGHVNPLLAVADAITQLDQGVEVIALGTNVGLEADLVPQAGYELATIEKVPFPRRPNMAALKFPMAWHRERTRVMKLIQDRHIQAVVGFGGYASAPAYSAAHKLHIPLLIHEQNARAGMANKLGARWASFIGTAYDNTGLQAKQGTMARVGLPLRPAIAQLAQELTTDREATRIACAQRLGVDPSKPIIVVTGGSLGAVSLNRAIASEARDLIACAQIVHLTGKGKDDEVRKLVTQSAGADVITGIGQDSDSSRPYHIAPYLERIDWAFGCADLVVCRSGAGTVSELTALGLPAIYVPLPIGNGEQRYNAQPVVNAGGGIMVNDADFTPQWVHEHIPALIRDTQSLQRMGEHAWQYGIRDAASRMAQQILAALS